VTFVCLLLSGAALLINGLAALNVVPGRDAAVFSLAIGSAQLVLGVTCLAGIDGAAGTGTQVLLSGAGMFLFGMTYAYVGLDFLLGLGSKGLGWFCGMVAAFGLLLATAWLGDDPLLAVLWVCWSVLWALLFASLALGLDRIRPFTGWALVLTSQVTATLPAFLGITGFWPYRTDAAALAAAVLAFLFLAAGVLARRGLSDPRRAHNGAPPSAPLASPPGEAAR
jgi:putative amide transporter protein